jgi:hypothetical protein
MIIHCELTDTFGGEANYSWVFRETVKVRTDSRLAIVRAAKSALGLSNVRCQVLDIGDTIEIRPIGICQVAFITC